MNYSRVGGTSHHVGDVREPIAEASKAVLAVAETAQVDTLEEPVVNQPLDAVVQRRQESRQPSALPPER
jgi:hypothetical protein